MAVAIVHAWLRPILAEEMQQMGKLRERLLWLENELVPGHKEYCCPYRHVSNPDTCQDCVAFAEYISMIREDIEEIQQRSSGAVALGAVCNM